MEKTNTIDLGLEAAAVQVVDLSKELLVLRLAWGKLKAAVADAAAPIAAVLVPALQDAVFWSIRLVKSVGQVIGALFGIQTAQDAVENSVTSTARAVKRSLAAFDQLNRLDAPDSSTCTVTEAVPLQQSSLSPRLQATVDKILALVEPLKSIDLTPLRWALARLGEAFGALGSQVWDAMQWIWQELLVPFVTWVIEKFLPVFLQSLQAGIELLTTVLGPLGDGFTRLWQAIKPVAAFVGDTVLVVFDQLRRLFVNLTDTVTEKSDRLTGIFTNIGQVISHLWQAAEPALTQLRTRWAKSFEDMGEKASAAAGFIIDSLFAVTEFLAGAFTGDWDRAWQGLSDGLKGSVNSVIGFLNALLSGVAGAINGVVRAVNKLSFTVPQWVPGLGGQTLGFSLRTVTTPQIPYLAQGAVLPANRPFLAVVGDQRHGTNVEAPLATIQEAVALVMGEQLSAMMAGFDATVNEIRHLHSTVSAIEVGDAVIGKAARRYAQKMAVLTGEKYL